MCVNTNLGLLFAVGETYVKFLIECVVESTETVVGEEQFGFRRDSSCTGQNFVLIKNVEGVN